MAIFSTYLLAANVLGANYLGTYHWIVHGCPRRTCEDDSQLPNKFCNTMYDDDGLNHGVRCCKDSNDDNDPLWHQNEGCSVWVASSLPDCYNVNWEEADRICADQGARLCTKDELDYPMMCGCWSGCGHDKRTVWTSEEEVKFIYREYYTVKGYSEGLCDEGTCDVRARDTDNRFAVRCCSWTDLGGWIKKDGCSVYANSHMSSFPWCMMVDWFRARDACWSLGARLCTKDELLNDCAAFSGCRFNNKMVWSSTVSYIS